MNIFFTKDEILTLSFGRTSNLVATSLFNSYISNSTLAQGESNIIDDRICFRNTSTYAPRSFLVDMKGSFGGVEIPADEQVENENAQWEGATDTYNFENTDDGILAKNDPRITINRDRSLHELKELRYLTNTFDTYTMGQEYFKQRAEEAEEILDQIRYLIEECDSLQGFQCLIDANSAFPGLAHDIMTQVKDEFKTPRILTFAISNLASSDTEKEKDLKTFNLAMSLSQMATLSSVYIPLSFQSWNNNSFPLLNYNSRDMLQSISIMASAIDSCLLSCRAKRERDSLYQICDLLSPVPKMNIGNLLCSIPFPSNITDYTDFKSKYVQSITQQFDMNSATISESITIRGVQKQLLQQPVLRYLFDDRALSKTGFIDEQLYKPPLHFPSLVGTDSVVPIAMYSNVQISKGMTKYLSKLSRMWSQLDKSQFSLDKEHVSDVTNDLETIAEEYQEA